MKVNPKGSPHLRLQIAAYEAKMGHAHVANEIKTLVDKAKENKFRNKSFTGDLQGLLIESPAFDNLNDLIVSANIKGKINRIISEFGAT